MPPNSQPNLPAEGSYTDLEQLFISEQPKNLWPVNQNSNLGAIRSVLTGLLQDALNTLSQLSIERYAHTASGYLTRWEGEVGLPKAPTGKTEAQRRTLVLGRLTKGPFRRARRIEIVESYIQATFGTPASLTPEGLSLDASGISLLSEAGVVTSLYRIYEDVKNFSYDVRIKDTVDPDFVGMTRELGRIEPGGITGTFAEFANILDYQKATIDPSPVGYWRFGTGGLTDLSGYGNTAVLPGAGQDPAAVAAPGLLVSGVDGANGSYDFDGTNDYITIPDAAQLDVGDLFSVEMLINADAFTSNPRLVSKGGLSFEIYLTTGGQLRLQVPTGGVLVAHSAINLSTATTYHIVVVKHDKEIHMYINGVDQVVEDNENIVFANNSTALEVGRTNGAASSFFNGRMDELAVYNRALTASKVFEKYNTSKNIP